ncbi:MAG: hypothetical protein ACRDYX_06585 [Egibacteraceae bacterium]
MSQDWFWEGNILIALARYLERQGWQITSTAEGGSADQGMGLVVRRDERELLVEVKGFPSAPPAPGPDPRAGQPRPARMSSKARQWYAHALLGVMLKRQAHPDAEVALALPAHRTYRSLVEQTACALRTLGVSVFLVSANGDVETPLAP